MPAQTRPWLHVALPAPGSVEPPPALDDGHQVVVLSPGDAGDAERLEYQVFHAAGFCEPSPTGTCVEYELYRDRSLFHCVIDSVGRTVAVVRSIVGAYDDLPVGSFPRQEGYPDDPVMEWATLAVADGVRGTGMAEALYKSSWYRAMRETDGRCVAIISDWVLELFRSGYGFPFRQLADARWYMGDWCYPVGVDGDAMLDMLADQPRFLADVAPGLHRDEIGGLPLAERWAQLTAKVDTSS
jgi:hypothetical protein